MDLKLISTRYVTKNVWAPAMNYIPMNINYPSELGQLLSARDAHYKKCNKDSAITHVPQAGYVIIKLTNRNSYEFNLHVTTIQAAVMFTLTRPMNADEIAQQTNLELQLVHDILQGLYMMKVLRKNKSEEYVINAMFTYKSTHVSVIEYSPNLRASIDAKTTEPVQIEQLVWELTNVDKQHVLQALMTDIMKQKQKLKAAQLKSQVTSVAQFEVTDAMYKKAIDYLIKQEYVERLGSFYKYVP